MQQIGTVKTFNAVRGWGFIEAESGCDFFFYQGDILMAGFRTVEPGTPVEFSEGRDESGRLRAVNVRPF
jgi:CspA family cold shock protein